MTRIAIIAAMTGELKPFLDANAKEGWAHEKRGNIHLWRLTWPGGHEWVAACAGAGVQAATRAFAEVEKDGAVSAVISVGWAGALTNQMEAGRVYEVSGVIDARTGERLLAHRWSAEDSSGIKHWLVTSPIVADAAEKRRLALAYGMGLDLGLVDMEAAGVARLAEMRGIPFYCIKGVSDGFRDQLPDFNRFISQDGKFQLSRFILFVLIRPRHWSALMRMGENSKKAALGIRERLLENLNRHDGTGA
jgi:adenosylhomocysteine nucleosidase